MGSDPQSYLAAQNEPIRLLREALVNRTKAMHDHALRYGPSGPDLRSTHEEPYQTCPSGGCAFARLALDRSKDL